MGNVIISHINKLTSETFEPILYEYRNDKEKYRDIFIRMSYLSSYSNDYRMKVMNDIKDKGIEGLYSNEIEKANEFQSLSLFPYSGNKLKFKKEMNQMFELGCNENIDTICDVFLGAGGTISSLYHSFIDKGIKNLVLNDLNESLIYTHSNIHKYKEEMINGLIDSYRTLHLLNDSIFFPSENTLDKLKQVLINSEKQELYSDIQTSILFLFFQTIQFSGTYESEIDENNLRVSKITSKIYDINKYIRGLLNSIDRIEEYNMIYNSFNTIFVNDDYKNIVNQFKNEESAFFLFDPPYYDCLSNYGFNDFNQRELLEKLSGLNFLYNNNKHIEIFGFIQKYNFHTLEKLRRVRSSGGIDTPVYEYILSSNSSFEEQYYEIIS